MPEIGGEPNVNESITFNPEGLAPPVVIRDPETKLVVSVGSTETEAMVRAEKLRATPTSVSSEKGDIINPNWLAAKAEALGLTIEEYNNLIDQKVEGDIGELVVNYGIDGVKAMVKIDQQITEGVAVHKAG